MFTMRYSPQLTIPAALHSVRMANKDADYYVPPERQCVFGAGVNHRRIDFVPAASTGVSLPVLTPPSKGPSIADRYLSLVLTKTIPTPAVEPEAMDTSASTEAADGPTPTTTLCSVCAAPLSPTHESTIAHQICLVHSHPPSHLDRSRNGLRYLQSYGWDPDERVGLGARSEGMRFPIKPVPKHNTAGLREKVDLEATVGKKVRKESRVEAQTKPVRLNAKQVRKREKEAKLKTDKMRRALYQSDEVDKYLGDHG
jgi:hypothetical protein